MRPSGGFVGNELAACLRSARTPLVDPFSVQLQQPWDCVRWMRKLLLLWRCLFRCFHIFVICWAGCIYLWCFGDYPFLSVIIQKNGYTHIPVVVGACHSEGTQLSWRRSTLSGDQPRSAKVAEAMGSTASGTSEVRDSAIKRGLVWSPERGRIAFTVPGMVDFIRRQQLD